MCSGSSYTTVWASGTVLLSRGCTRCGAFDVQTRRTCHPWSIKIGLAEVLLNMWLAKDILSVILGLVLFPSSSPQSFTQRFYVLSLHWQPPTSHSQHPEVRIQSLPKDFNRGHQLLLPTFLLKACEPLVCRVWGRSNLQILSRCEGNPSGAWVVHKPSVGPVFRTKFCLTHNCWHRKARRHSSCQLSQPTWATGNILMLNFNMLVDHGCFPFCRANLLLWAFRPTHWCHKALIKSTPLEIKR